MEIKTHISSKSSRNIDSNNSPSKFKTIFDKPLTLNQNKIYVFGLDKIETMTYSWYNISEQYNNDTIRHGVVSEEKDEQEKVTNPYVITFHNIHFPSGSYSYNNINEYIKNILILNKHDPDAIKIEFDLSKFKCELSLKSGYVLDLTNSNFGNLIGFEEKVHGFTDKLENSTHYGTKNLT